MTAPSKGAPTDVHVKLPDDLVKDVDAHAADLSKRTGLRATRTDAIDSLLRRGLRDSARDRKGTVRGERDGAVPRTKREA